MQSRFYAGVASLVVAALLFVLGEDRATIPPAIVFTVLGAILVARAKR
jgi:hypothetical protein